MCDITGEEVSYAAGGKGGSNVEQKPGAAGTGIGDVGDGGSGGLGGAGADGIVIVRIKDVYRSIKVPIPGVEDVMAETPDGSSVLLETKMVTPRFVWSDWYDKDEPCVAFEYEGSQFRSSTDAKPHNWSDAIKAVTGTTVVDCYEEVQIDGGGTKVGVGYYQFTVSLNDGYLWEDAKGAESRGDTLEKQYRWAIVEDAGVTNATLNLHKAVDWVDTTNAIVNVKTTSTPETSVAKPVEVLFLAALCSAHGFSDDVIHAALDAATVNANVTYEFWDKFERADQGPRVTGIVHKGEHVSEKFELPTANHMGLSGFYSSIYNQIAQGKSYDYIILAFDRSLVAYDFRFIHPQEKEIAAWLKPYYERNAVIWLVDALAERPDDDPDDMRPAIPCVVPQYPWFPNPCIFMEYDKGNSGYDHWSTLGWMNTQYPSIMGKALVFPSIVALMGIFDPVTYEKWAEDDFRRIEQEYERYTILRSTHWSTPPFEPSYATFNLNDYSLNHPAESNAVCEAVRVFSGKGVPADHQEIYDNADKVGKMIGRLITAKPFNLVVRDKIMDREEGLTLETVSLLTCTNLAAGASNEDSDWTEVMKWHADTDKWEWIGADYLTGGGYMKVNKDANTIECVLSNVTFQLATRTSINVKDDGRFRVSEGAVYNQLTGMWEKNPNDGVASAELWDPIGNTISVEGETKTEVPWEYTGYTIISDAINGETYVQGRNIWTIHVGAHADCRVYYRGFGGYRLTELEVDGEKQSVADYPSFYTFPDVQTNHEVHVKYEPFVTGAESTPVTNLYDGAEHLYDVTVHLVTNEFGNVREGLPPTETRYAPLWVLDDPDKATNDLYWVSAGLFRETYCTNDQPVWAEGEFEDVGDHEIAYRVYAKQSGYGEDMSREGWVWVKIVDPDTDHSVILPQPLVVQPRECEDLIPERQYLDSGYTLTGFVSNRNLNVFEDLASIRKEYVTNGWQVTWNSVTTGGVALLNKLWVCDKNGNALWDGNPLHLEPTNPPPDAIDSAAGLYNFGNYYLIDEPYYMRAMLMTHWICDHADAGASVVHLAICPTLKCSKTGDATKTLHDFIQVNEGHFGLVSGFTEDELTNAVPVPVVYRANPNGYDGEQDIARGWIWFTATNSVLPDGSTPALRKILWTP